MASAAVVYPQVTPQLSPSTREHYDASLHRAASHFDHLTVHPLPHHVGSGDTNGHAGNVARGHRQGPRRVRSPSCSAGCVSRHPPGAAARHSARREMCSRVSSYHRQRDAISQCVPARTVLTQGHPFKITETISALKALESAFVVALCGQRYGRAPRPAPIDVENVGLFLLSPSIASLNGRPATDPFLPVRDCDIHDTFKHRYRQLCSAIFRTFDDRFFNLHGGVDARPVQNVVGVPPNRVELKDRETIVRFYAEGVGLCESEDLAEELDQKKLDGTIVYTEEGECEGRSVRRQSCDVQCLRDVRGASLCRWQSVRGQSMCDCRSCATCRACATCGACATCRASQSFYRAC